MEASGTNPAGPPPVAVEGRPSIIGRVAIAASVISLIGFLILLIGDLAGIEGAKEGEDGSFIFDIAWVSFSFGAIVALVTGLVAFIQGRRRSDAGTSRAGRIGLIYFVAAVLFVVLYEVIE